MIHIFNACGAICTLPCKACTGLCTCCREGCGSVCSCCGKTCTEMGTCVGKACESCEEGLSSAVSCCSSTCGTCCGSLCSVLSAPLRKPLAGYFVLAVMFGIPLIVTGASGLSRVGPAECGGLQALSIGYIVFGVLHILFTLHVQERLSASAVLEEEAPASAGSEGGAGLARRAWRVMLYDVGFALYLLTAIASFVFGIWAFFKSMDCLTSGPLMASVLLIVFGPVSVAYAGCWAATVCCCGLGDRALGRRRPKPEMQGAAHYGSQQCAGAPVAAVPVAAAQPVPPPSPFTAP